MPVSYTHLQAVRHDAPDQLAELPVYAAVARLIDEAAPLRLYNAGGPAVEVQVPGAGAYPRDEAEVLRAEEAADVYKRQAVCVSSLQEIFS